ncbi:tubulin polyglutamylase complex subunit 2 isoform X3 [Thalassophryne amazonica]|uniref:tubulin polyglutamylase complex subunit 2 isoform X3 n=1 Tax=Thalassophryne amazonica TaxID=390379 RepID=UPI001471DF9F|nr:tubulin polyglutamylase complex subunit 2 isoform X3 [Thalassophryne amazonica]
MEETQESLVFKGVAERLTLGITRILENMPGVVDVRFVEREPAEKRCLLSWEQKNTCILPEDLRDFYLTTDGFTLTWNVKLDESEIAPFAPHFDSQSRIFELDSCGGNGKVCLVYKKCNPGVVAQQSEIWFLDRSLCWHFLTKTFTSYYRLMITHLGLPEWQYAFTPYGPGPQAKQWASLYQPLIFSSELTLADPAGDSHLNQLDPTKAFKGKAKVLAPKKKQSPQCSVSSAPKNQSSISRNSGTKR